MIVDFFSNWQCLGYKQINYRLMWNLFTNTWDLFFLYENRIEILVCHKCCVYSDSMNCCFYLGVELFFFIHLSSYFFIEPWYEMHLLASCYHVGCHCRPTPSAYQPCWRTWFLLALSEFTYFTSCVRRECIKWCSHTFNLLFFFLLVCLLVTHVAYLECRGSAELEKACIQGTYVSLIDLTCLMKAVRR